MPHHTKCTLHQSTTLLFRSNSNLAQNVQNNRLCSHVQLHCTILHIPYTSIAVLITFHHTIPTSKATPRGVKPRHGTPHHRPRGKPSAAAIDEAAEQVAVRAEAGVLVIATLEITIRVAVEAAGEELLQKVQNTYLQQLAPQTWAMQQGRLPVCTHVPLPR